MLVKVGSQCVPNGARVYYVEDPCGAEAASRYGVLIASKMIDVDGRPRWMLNVKGWPKAPADTATAYESLPFAR